MSNRLRSNSVASSHMASEQTETNNNNKYRSWRTLELVGRPNQKEQKSHDFFKQTKISTCSYVKKDGTHFKAVPYYVRPKQKYSEFLNRSMYSTSMNSDTYKNSPQCHSAMRKKPLQIYNPNARRSRLPATEYRFHSVNKSEIEIGNRGEMDKKHYLTTNANHIGNFGLTTPCSHPLIQAQRAKWNHHLKKL